MLSTAKFVSIHQIPGKKKNNKKSMKCSMSITISIGGGIYQLMDEYKYTSHNDMNWSKIVQIEKIYFWILKLL